MTKPTTAQQLEEILYAADFATHGAIFQELQAQLQALVDRHVQAAFKTFFDTFEKEIDQQEFAIDEAEWLSLIQAMHIAEKTALQAQQPAGRGDV